MKKLLLVLSILLCVTSVAFSESVTQMQWTVKYANGTTRTGKYTGDITNGIPHGYGLFTSKNPNGDIWHYIGYWSNGIMHGAGLMVWESGQQQNGIFSNGEFKHGTEVQEVVFPDYSFVDLPYYTAVEDAAKDEVFGNLKYIKQTHNYGFVNVYVDLSAYVDKRQANKDACTYAINLIESVYVHPDLKCIEFYFQSKDSSGKMQTAIIMKIQTSKAAKMDFESLRNLIQTNLAGFTAELERCEFMNGYQKYVK